MKPPPGRDLWARTLVVLGVMLDVPGTNRCSRWCTQDELKAVPLSREAKGRLERPCPRAISLERGDADVSVLVD